MPNQAHQPDKIEVHDQHMLVFPMEGIQSTLSPELQKQLVREVAIGVCTYDADLSIDLQFGCDGAICVIMHSVYQHTLVGQTLASLAYAVQGYVHGGMLKSELLMNWEDNPAIHLDHLDKTQILDAKQFYKDHFPHVSYQSLSELLYAAGLDRKPGEEPTETDQYAVKFSSIRPSFQVEFTQTKMSMYDNLISIAPEWSVIRKLHAPLDYELYLDEYRETHGEVPPDYESFDTCCFNMCKQIKENLPKLCPEIFEKLRFIQGVASYFKALKSAHKMPEFAIQTIPNSVNAPMVFPPFLVACNVDAHVVLTLSEIFQDLMSQPDWNLRFHSLSDGALQCPPEFDAYVKSRIWCLVTQRIQTQDITLHEGEINKVLYYVKYEAQYYGKVRNASLQTLVDEINKSKPALAPLLAIQPIVYGEIENQHLVSLAQIRTFVKEQSKAEKKRLNSTFHSDEWLEEYLKKITAEESIHPKRNQAMYNVNRTFASFVYSYLALADKPLQDANTTLKMATSSSILPLTPITYETGESAALFAENMFKGMVNTPVETMTGILHGAQHFSVFKLDVMKRIIFHPEAYKLLCNALMVSKDAGLWTDIDLSALTVFLESEADTLTFDPAKKNQLNQTLFDYAVQLKGTPKKLNTMMAASPGVAAYVDRDGFLPLHTAAFSGQVETIQLILTQHPTQLNQTNKKGYTPLMLAAMQGVSAAVDALLTLNADPNRVLSNGLSALYLAIQNGHTTAALSLVNHPSTQLDLCTADQSTPLHVAIEQRLDEVALQLIEKGADFDQYRRSDGNDAMAIIANTGGSPQIMRTILTKMAVRRDELIATYEAYKKNIEEIKQQNAAASRQTKKYGLRDLVGLVGAGMSWSSQSGFSSTYNAMYCSHPLLSANTCDAMPMNQPVQGQHAHGRFLGHVAELFEAIAPKAKQGSAIPPSYDEVLSHIDACLSYFRRPLTYYIHGGYTATVHLAALRGHMELVKLLIAFEPGNADTKNGLGDTALMLALRQGKQSMALYLASIVPMNLLNNANESAALRAVKSGQLAVFDVLYERHEDISLQDLLGHHALYYLLKRGEYHRYVKAVTKHPEWMLLMVKERTTDQDALSSLAIAEKEGHPLLASFLRSKGVESKGHSVMDNGLSSSLYFALQSDDVDYVQKIPMIAADLSRCTTLAAEYASMRCLKAMMPGLEDQYWPEVMTGAVKSRELAVIEYVLSFTDDRNRPLNANGQTVAHLVVSHGLMTGIERLSTQGVDFISSTDEKSPAFLAIKADHDKCFKRLMALHEVQPDEWLSWTIRYNSTECGKRILKGSFSDKSAELALKTVVELDMAEDILHSILKRCTLSPAILGEILALAIHQDASKGIIECLLKSNADPMTKHPTLLNQDAFSLAKARTRVDVIELLIQYKGQCSDATQWKTHLLNIKDHLESDKQRLLIAHEARDSKTVLTILTTFPMDTVLLGPKNAPFLQILFSLSFENKDTDKHDEAYVNAVLSGFKNMAWVNPLVRNAAGEGLVWCLKDNTETAVQLKMAWINQYFSENARVLVQESFTTKSLLGWITASGAQALLSAGFPRVGEDGTPAMHTAAYFGYKKMVQFLMSDGQLIDVGDRKQITPLMTAVTRTSINLNSIRFLVEECGANPNARDLHQKTALHYAILANRLEVALYLINFTKHLNTPAINGQTPFIMAAAQGMLPVCEVLLPHVQDLYQIDRKGKNALHWAARHGHVNVIEFLLNCGMDVQVESGLIMKQGTSRKETPLHLAVDSGRMSAVNCLLKQGADVTVSTSYGSTVLDLMAWSSSPEILSVLTTLPAFYDEKWQIKSLLSAAFGGNVALLQILLLNNVPVNANDENGRNALHRACRSQAEKISALLIEAGIFIESADNAGDTPLHIAAETNAHSILRMMFGRGINPDLMNKQGETPLYVAAKNGHEEALMLLVCLGAKFALPAKEGLTPMQAALMEGQRSVVDVLFIFGDCSVFEPSFVEMLSWRSPHLIPILNELYQLETDLITTAGCLLHQAVLLQHVKAIRLLCDAMPAFRAKENNQGQTPLALAKAKGFTEVAAILEYYQGRQLSPLLAFVAPRSMTHDRSMSAAEILFYLRKDEKRYSTATDVFIDDYLADIWAAATLQPLANLLSTLSKNTQKNYLAYDDLMHSNKETLDLEKYKFRGKWLQLLKEIAAHSKSLLAELDVCVLSPYPWTVIFSDKPVLFSLFSIVSQIMINKDSTLRAWFFAYMKPLTVRSMTAKEWTHVLSRFEAFMAQLARDQHIGWQTLLCLPPKESISFYRGSDYMERVMMALTQATSLLQLSILDDLPSMRHIEQAAALHLPFVTQRMVHQDEIKRETNLGVIPCFERFKARVLTAFPKDYDFLSYFYDTLNGPLVGSMSPHHQFILAKNVYDYSDTYPAKDTCDPFVRMAEKIKKILGDAFFAAFFDFDVSMKVYLAVGEKALALFDKKHMHPRDMIEKLSNWTTFSETIHHEYEQHILTHISKENVADLKKRFMQTTAYIKFPLPEAELDQLLAQYQQIIDYRTTLREAGGRDVFIAEIAKQGAQLAQTPDCIEARVRLLAAIREMVCVERGIYPYDTQMLTLLAMLNKPETCKGRIAQVRTGEGKSTLVAMLSAYHAVQGEYVDVITSSRNLAERDELEYKAFYEAIGTSSSNVNIDHPTEQNFTGHIIYGTSFDFEFSLMGEVLYESKVRHQQGKPRPCGTAIVDEADNLFLDAAYHSARMTLPSPEDIRWIYLPVFQYVRKKISESTATTFGLSDLTVDDAIAIHRLLMDYQEGRHLDQASAFTQKQLLTWCRSALIALSSKEGESYVVTPKTKRTPATITIVDYLNTGRKNTGTRWSQGVHEFLEVKHGLPPRTESLSAASMAHPAFFNLYKNIFGLTGTMGQDHERAELKTIYNLDLFDVPPHRPFLRQTLEPQYHVNKEAYQKAIIDGVKARVKDGRPVLLLCKSIEESLAWEKLLKENGLKNQVLNEEQKEDEDYLLSQAGRPGRVTIATNAAGRGTDIKLSKESIANGGLHVSLTFFPVNERVEDQAMGRASRQGEPGSCQLIVYSEDDEIKMLVPHEPHRTTMPITAVTELYRLRTEKTDRVSTYRMEHAKREMALHKLFQQFGEVELASLRPLVRTLVIEPLVTSCEQYQQPDAMALTMNLVNNRVMEGALLRATSLFREQRKGDAVDWRAFIKSCQDVYLDYLTQQWALLYTEINEDDEPFDEIRIQTLYAAFIQQHIQPVKDNSSARFGSFIHQILWISMNQLTPKVAPAESESESNGHTSQEEQSQTPSQDSQSDEETRDPYQGHGFFSNTEEALPTLEELFNMKNGVV